ncbi:hypothetical protein G9A89_020816 [Geosiphon pyriformis]|nr:hypothetical protein G9A89_020816 [Geosiphon pyriformis]
MILLKKVVLGNIKHSGDKRDISLSKFESSNSIYSDVKSLSDEDEDVSMSGANGGSLLGLAATISKAKRVNTSAGFGSLLGSSNFYIDNNEVVLFPHLPISLEKKWIDPKIIKTSVEVSVKKSFALDINLLAVEEKLVMAKTQLIRKFFLIVNGFGRATTSSKFEEIIRSTFTSEKNMEMATSLAKEKGINVNNNLKRQGLGEIKLIKIQLIGLWQKAVVEFAELASRDWFRALLFTLPALLCCGWFESEDAMESAYHTESIFSGVKLSWAKLDLVCCEKCGLLGHSALECNVLVPISRSAAFGGKSWAQVVSFAFSSGNFYFSSGTRSDFFSPGSSGFKRNTLVVQSKFSINNCLTSLERFLELLADQVSDIMRRLNGVKFVPLVSITQVVLPATPVLTLASLDTNMVLDVPQSSLFLSSSVLKNKVADLDLSSLKILTSKVGGLESKIMALEVSIGSILRKLDLLCINSGSLIYSLHQ